MENIECAHEINAYASPNCYLCQTPGKLIYHKLQDRLYGASGEWNLKKCTNSECGLVWLDPMPQEEDLEKAYKSYYTHETDDNEQKNFIKVLLRKVYRSVKTVPSHLLGLRAEEIKLENMYLQNVEPGRLLDVGCGSGKFLNSMQLAGWEVEGIDFDAKAANSAFAKYGIQVCIGTLESIRYTDNYFDAITMSHVIEHVPDPVALLQECHRILKPGGYLVAITPNINSWGHQKFGNNWRGLEPPRHLHLFSPNTLRECARKAGYHNIDICTTAADSIGIFIASINIKQRLTSPKLNLINFVQALFFQYYEFILARKYVDIGEVAVLLCRKT